MTHTEGSSLGYVLGSSDRELQRLGVQAEYYRFATEDALRRAGVGRGMKVLDIGCGTGAVSVAAAELVGPTGSVLGVDFSDEPLRIARHLVVDLGLGDRVRFERQDITSWRPAELFDALIGRLVLMHLPDPAATLASLSQAVRPGGLILLQEFVVSMVRQDPPTDLFARTLELIVRTFRATGRSLDLGLSLGAVFRDAGLGAPIMTLATRWEDDPEGSGYRLLAEALRTLLPVAVRFGFATEEDTDIETLESRLRADARATCAGVCASPMASAWIRTATGNAAT